MIISIKIDSSNVDSFSSDAAVKMKAHRSLKLLLLTIFITAIAAVNLDDVCGIIDIDQYHNKNNITNINEFPWMGRVAFNDTLSREMTFLCQAILITEQQLISAAHCLRDNAAHEAFAVALGDWDSRNNISESDCNDDGICSKPILIDIDEIVIHPYYNSRRRENDISLVRLVQAVTFTDFIHPICLPNKEVQEMEFGSEELMLTGWLRKKEGGLRRKLPVVLFNILDCRRKYKNHRVNITDSFLCGITCEEGIFHLAGSALMNVEFNQRQRAYLVGFPVFGPTFCGDRVPDVMTRVDRYIDWIKDNIY